MGRGGFGGGGRSGGFGGSGGRSGGSFGGFGRSGSSFGSGNRSGSSGGFFGSGRPRGGGFFGFPLIIHTRSGGGSSGNNNQDENSNPSSNGNNLGCLAAFIVIIGIVILMAIVFSISSDDISKSTIEREALSSGAVNETGYFTDELDWIDDEDELIDGMEHFYDKTGVQPYLYITDTINGKHYPTEDDYISFADDNYSKLFTDEAHLIIVFFEYNNQHQYYYLAGDQAKTVFDDEANNIFSNYIDRYYYDENLSSEEFFSKSFADSADRIMTITKSPWIPVLIILGVLAILVLLFLWWKNHKKQKNIEAQQTEDILNTPIEKFGDTEAEELGKKYDDNNDNETKTI